MKYKMDIKNLNSINDRDEAVKFILENLQSASFARSFKTHCQEFISKFCEVGLPANAQLYLFLNPDANRNCRHCGAKLNRFWGPGRGWGHYCNRTCSTQAEQRKQKYTESSIQKFGTAHPLQIKEVYDKIQLTNIERYGHKSNLHADEFKDDIRNTINSKIAKTQEKVKNTCIARYGASSAYQSPNALAAIKSAQDKKLKERDANRIELLKEHDFTLIKYDEINLIHTWVHSCGEEIESKSVSLSCKKCSVSHRSGIEMEIFEWIRNNIPSDIQMQHSVSPFSVSKKHIDIYFPDYKFGVEINGLYWHQDVFDDGKMLWKTEQSIKDGIDLIHIWEHEWNEHTKNLIKAKLGLSNRIFARNCYVTDITTELARKFCSSFHRQGYAPSKYAIGLFDGNHNLLSVLTFGKPRFNKSAQWEIIRYCSLHNTTIIGGFNKMLKYFERAYLPKSICTYADRSYGTGEIYKQSGFAFIYSTERSYFWANSACIILSRHDTQKKKLISRFGKENIDMNLSEAENMKNLHFWKCSNIGNNFFIKQY